MSTAHQRLVSELAVQLGSWFRGKPCEFFVSPIDVRLLESDQAAPDAETVVQPDLLVVCDPKKVEEQGLTGAPDFVIEVLSPSTASRDLIVKAELYEAHGVREYWVIDPFEKVVTIRLLSGNGRFSPPRVVPATEPIPVSLFAGLALTPFLDSASSLSCTISQPPPF